MLTGCAGTTAHRFAGGLSQAVLDQNDPETVRAGIPAYLLLIDGLIINYPDDRNLLADGARLYSAYAAVFVDAAARAQHRSPGTCRAAAHHRHAGAGGGARPGVRTGRSATLSRCPVQPAAARARRPTRTRQGTLRKGHRLLARTQSARQGRIRPLLRAAGVRPRTARPSAA